MRVKELKNPSRPRVRAVCHDLKQMAFTKGPDAKLPTQQELCQLYGVSITTINNALEQLEAQNVILRRQGSGIYVSPRIHRKTIAIVFNSHLLGANASPFWGSLLSEFAALAATRGQSANQDFEYFITSPSADPHAALPDHVTRTVRTGVINGVVAVNLNEASAEWLVDQGVPCVAYAGGSKWTVVTDNERFVYSGLKVLADQGCRCVEYWGLPRPGEIYYQKMSRDIEAACAEIGIALSRSGVGPAVDLMPESRITGAERANIAIKTLYGDPARPRPDGIFIGDDMMANHLLIGLLEMGIRPGVDVKIASLANKNSSILFGHEHRITLMEFDPAEIAGALIRLLDQAMANPDLPDAQVCVPWRVRLPEASRSWSGE